MNSMRALHWLPKWFFTWHIWTLKSWRKEKLSICKLCHINQANWVATHILALLSPSIFPFHHHYKHPTRHWLCCLAWANIVAVVLMYSILLGNPQPYPLRWLRNRKCGLTRNPFLMLSKQSQAVIDTCWLVKALKSLACLCTRVCVCVFLLAWYEI